MNGKKYNDFVNSCWPQFPVASGDGRLLFLNWSTGVMSAVVLCGWSTGVMSAVVLCGWSTGVMSAVVFRKENTRRRVLLEEKKIACIFIGPGCIY
jgi:hypothetical protein